MIDRSLDFLEKTDDLEKGELKLSDSKKYKETKRSINRICRGLTTITKEYRPEKTIEEIEIYASGIDKMPRILYSEISSYLFNVENEKRSIFLTNIEKMLLYVLDDEIQIEEDISKIVVKIYDHTQLVNYQVESMNNIFAQRLSDAKVDLNSEIKNVEKEYITILGIFASIVLAFVGSFTFSTSVLNNVTNTNAYKLVIIALVIGFVFFNIIDRLMSFLIEINNKYDVLMKASNERFKSMNSFNKIIAIILIMALIGYGLTKIELPKTIHIECPLEYRDENK